MLAVVVHRRVVGAGAVHRALFQPARKRVAVALAAQRRLQAAVGVDVTEIAVAQVQMMNADIAGHRQSLALGGTHHFDRAGGRQATDVHARARRPHELEQGRKRNRLGERRNAREPEPRGDLAVVRNAAFREPSVLGAQPHRKAEGCGVLQRPPQHLGIRNGRVRLRKGHAAGLGELRHFGEPLAFELHGERTNGIHARARQRLGAPAQHVDQPRLIERRIGVRRTGEARDAAGEGCFHLRFERRLVFEARLAQPRREIYEPGRRHQSLGVDHALGPRELLGDFPVRDVKVAHAVAAARRVDHTGIFDGEAH